MVRRIKNGGLRAVYFWLIFMFVGGMVEFAYMEVIFAFSDGQDTSSIGHYQNLIHGSDNVFYLLISQALQMLALAFSSVIFSRLIDSISITNLAERMTWDSRGFMFGSAAGFAAISLLAISGFFIKTAPIHYNGLHPSIIFQQIVLFVFVAVNEEVLCRGFIYENLKQQFPRLVALLVTSIFFSLLHIFNSNFGLLAFSNLFLSGVLLGLIYDHYKSIWLVIGIHFTWNLFQGPIYGFEISGLKVISIIEIEMPIDHLLTGGDFGLEGGVAATILLTLLCAIYLFAGRERYFVRQKV